MKTIILGEIDTPEEQIKFFRNTFCIASTENHGILGCNIDIMVHEITLPDGETLYSYRPVNPIIKNDEDTIKITSIYVPKFQGVH